MNREDSRKNLSQEVYEQLLRNISTKVWRSGDKLPPEKELMQIYSVSRITIREAIRQLVSLGLLKTVQGSGTYVCEYNSDVFIAPVTKTAYLSPTTKADVLNILNVRLLEVIVAGQAAQCSTEEGIAQLEAIHRRLQSQPKSIEVHAAVDAEFHMQICSMTNNPFMIQVCRTIYDALEKVMPTISQIMGSDYALHYHGKLIDTIKKHYVTEAKATMEEHLLVTIQAVEQVPEDSELFTSGNKYKEIKERPSYDLGNFTVHH